MWSSSAEISRRSFLRGTAGGIVTLLLDSQALLGSPERLFPEYCCPEQQLLIVYDQCAAEHLLREMVEILRQLPPAAQVHVLASTPRLKEARRRFQAYGFEGLRYLDGGPEPLTGWWGRDILQAGTDERGERTIFVPWDKGASRREELDRTLRTLRVLESSSRRVVQLPVAAEGGNLMVDRHAGKGRLFAGSTIAVETRGLYLSFYGVDPGDQGVAEILCDALGCEEVVWIGPRGGSGLRRQSPFLFHLDMGMTILAPGLAVVGRSSPEELGEEEHLRLLRGEAERTARALQARGSWPEGLDLPQDPALRGEHLETRLALERTDLREAAEELDAVAEQLSTLGYRVERVPARPRSLRRFQSYTNVLPIEDRVLLPVYPTQERVHGWILRHDSGRDRVEVELGVEDSDYEWIGDNLEAYRLYDALVGEVRPVRDYFYLAGGNVHCVVGRLGGA